MLVCFRVLWPDKCVERLILVSVDLKMLSKTQVPKSGPGAPASPTDSSFQGVHHIRHPGFGNSGIKNDSHEGAPDRAGSR